MTTSTARFAEVYECDGHTAVVVNATDHKARLRRVVDGNAAEGEFTLTQAQLTRDWRLIQTLPTLTCVGTEAANQAAKFLAGKGVTNVFANGNLVAAAMDPTSVIRFAEDALAKGWADDAECGRMIGELG